MTSINFHATSTFFMLDNELQRTIVEFILGDGKLVSDGISSHRNPTSVNLKDG